MSPQLKDTRVIRTSNLAKRGANVLSIVIEVVEFCVRGRRTHRRGDSRVTRTRLAATDYRSGKLNCECFFSFGLIRS